MSYLYRSYRQNVGLEGIYLGDAIALLSCLDAELFETDEMSGDVEVTGELTSGMTVFDRRRRSDAQANMDVVVRFDTTEVRESLLRGLRYAAQETRA